MSIKRGLVLLICALLIGLCVWHILQVPPFLQYVMAAPAAATADDAGGEGKKPTQSPMMQTLQRLKTLSESWTGIVEAYAVTSDAARVLLSGIKEVEAHLTGEYGSAEALPQRLLLAGRNFYAEELKNGADVIILDEQLAIALFRVGDPVGRAVTLNGRSFTVVGIARHKRAAGAMEAYGAYVPLLALQDASMETMTVWGVPVKGAGALSKFKADMQTFAPQGNLYSLGKERFRALLPVWLLATVAGLLLLLAGYRVYARFVMRLVSDYRMRLQSRFAVQLAPRMTAYLLLGVAALAGLLALSYAWAQLMLMPVSAFPEWVPAVPVEVNEILSTYWKNVQETCRAVEYRSELVLSLRMGRGILRILCLVAGAVCVHTFGVLRGKNKRDKQRA